MTSRAGARSGREVDVTIARTFPLRRRVGLAGLALVAVAAPGLAAEDPTFEAYQSCVVEVMTSDCLASVAIDAHERALAEQCAAVREAHGFALASGLLTERHLDRAAATAEANRRIARIETAMAGEYRKCIGASP